MVALPHQLARQFTAGRDADGWALLDTVADRLPPRGTRPWHLTGPHTLYGTTPAHGVLYRDTHTLRECAVVMDGWMLWRSRGPHMQPVLDPTGNPSALISHANPVLAQPLRLGWCPSGARWRLDPDAWTAEAITRGQKPAGYFSLGARRNRAWQDTAERHGLTVAAAHRHRYLHASHRAAVGELFDLDTLAAEYQRVLPHQLGCDAARALQQARNLSALEVCRDHESHHPAVTGLVLGYPPETTAGHLLPRHHPRQHSPTEVEYGTHCPHCDRPSTRWH